MQVKFNNNQIKPFGNHIKHLTNSQTPKISEFMNLFNVILLHQLRLPRVQNHILLYTNNVRICFTT